MSKLRVMSVFGTRPEAIKMAPLVKELEAEPEIESIVCVTAQHREMLDQVLTAFDLHPDFDLDVMEPGQTLSTITAKVLLRLGEVLEQAKPDLVLVHGDTSTSFVAALAAFYAKIPVGHVEAGLRSFDKYSPYPEEMNRRLTGVIGELHFAPTAANRDNLAREGITNNVFITGNTVIDALSTTVRQDYAFEDPDLRQLDFSRRLVLLTSHRRENYGEPMENIFGAVRTLAEENPEVTFVCPVHLSPYVQQTARKHLENLPNVCLTAPLGVFDMHNLMARAEFILTDSGGIQEEAPALGKPVLVLRRETERPEAVAAGTVRLAGTERENILALARELMQGGELYTSMHHAVNPYGDGQASRRICQNILFAFGRQKNPAKAFGEA